jgi:hypothetical protein
MTLVIFSHNATSVGRLRHAARGQRLRPGTGRVAHGRGAGGGA